MTRRRHRRTDAPRHSRILIRGGLTSLFLLALGYVAITSYGGVPGRSYDHLIVDAPRIGSLIAHDTVRIRGRRVGQVSSISPAARGSRLDLQLNKDTVVPADSRVLLRANGLLGARYVEIVPGRSDRHVPRNALIRAGDDALTFGVTDALDTFDGATRNGLRNTLGGLGKGLLGRGDGLSRALGDGAEAIVPAQRLFATMAEDGPAVDSLIPSLDAAARTLDRHRAAYGRILRPAGDGLRPFGDEDEAVRGALREGPAALRTAAEGLDSARGLLGAVRALSRQAHPLLTRAPSGLRSATRLLREARVPVYRARPLVRAVARTVPAVLELTGGLRPVAPPLLGAFDRVRTMADRIAPHECDLVNFAVVFRSMTGFGGIGEGPAGPAMHFRLQAAVTPADEAAGTSGVSGLVKRIGYPRACQYLATPYPAVSRPGAGGR